MFALNSIARSSAPLSVPHYSAAQMGEKLGYFLSCIILTSINSSLGSFESVLGAVIVWLGLCKAAWSERSSVLNLGSVHRFFSLRQLLLPLNSLQKVSLQPISRVPNKVTSHYILLFNLGLAYHKYGFDLISMQASIIRFHCTICLLANVQCILALPATSPSVKRPQESYTCSDRGQKG